jgi:hypothetical protein
VWIVLTRRNVRGNLWKNWYCVGMSMRGSAESDGDSRALASVSDGRFVLCASLLDSDVLGVEE